jgi:hypothetical protein
MVRENHQDGRVQYCRILSLSSAEFDAIQPRHHQIEHDQASRKTFERRQACETVEHGGDRETCRRENPRHHLGKIRIVLNHQDVL